MPRLLLEKGLPGTATECQRMQKGLPLVDLD
jgi:hypothetical protein